MESLRFSSFRRLAPGAVIRLCVRRPWLVLATGLVLLLAAVAADRLAGGRYADNFSLPGSQSNTGLSLLREHHPGAGGFSSQVVFHLDKGSLVSGRDRVERSVARIGRLPHVLATSDPLSRTGISRDGRTAYSTIHFDVNPASLGSGYLQRVAAAVEPARQAGVAVDYGDPLGQPGSSRAQDRRSELIGVAVAIAVLLAAFGSAIAAGLALFSAVFGLGIGISLLGVVAARIAFGTAAPTLATMMALGVGIDYALFIVTRHRQQLANGIEPGESVRQAVLTSGRAVIVAAATVVIALLGLFASGVDFIGKLGLAAAIAVAVAALTALTLVPALLKLVGPHIDRIRVRTPQAESPDAGGWHQYATLVSRRPLRFLLAGLAILLLLATPLVSMHLGHIDAGAQSTSSTDRRAYDEIERAFGTGANGPLTIVVKLTPEQQASRTESLQLADQVRRALAQTPDVASAAPVLPTRDDALLVTTVVPKTGPQNTATDALMNHLTDTVLPSALAASGAQAYVTGTTAAQLQFRNVVANRLPVIIGVVLLGAFLLLLLVFRSPLVALKAALLNLLSTAASYGLVVAVFQWGWGRSLLGVGENVPIESYVPMMIFAIVFGLSMDYEVFLLSRIREAWLATGDNSKSVADGLAATARVITSAALIMASVFFAFLLSNNVVIKMLALGLGASVIIDATLVRLVLVPATMNLLGNANWWTPRWLDRLLPNLDPETGNERAPTTPLPNPRNTPPATRPARAAGLTATPARAEN
jgi:RND superfamily putative drug exporter